MALVESEAIAEIEYDPGRRALFVHFVDGEWYTYFDVARSTYDAFVSADSHGRFFQKYIRGRYNYLRGRSPAA